MSAAAPKRKRAALDEKERNKINASAFARKARSAGTRFTPGAQAAAQTILTESTLEDTRDYCIVLERNKQCSITPELVLSTAGARRGTKIISVAEPRRRRHVTKKTPAGDAPRATDAEDDDVEGNDDVEGDDDVDDGAGDTGDVDKEAAVNSGGEDDDAGYDEGSQSENLF